MNTANRTELLNRKGLTNGKLLYEIVDDNGYKHTRTSARVYDSAAIVVVTPENGDGHVKVVYSSKASMDADSAISQLGYGPRHFTLAPYTTAKAKQLGKTAFEEFKKNRIEVTCVRF